MFWETPHKELNAIYKDKYGITIDSNQANEYFRTYNIFKDYNIIGMYEHHYAHKLPALAGYYVGWRKLISDKNKWGTKCFNSRDEAINWVIESKPL